MSFFDSEIIKSELKEINDLQRTISDDIYHLSYMNDEQKNKFLDKMERLLELQKIMVTRLKLSETPEAKEFEIEVARNARKMGYGPDVTVSDILDGMGEFIRSLRQST